MRPTVVVRQNITLIVLTLLIYWNPTEAAGTENCNNFWTNGFPSDGREPPITMPVCEEYPVDVLPSGRFRIFHPQDWLDAGREQRLRLAIESTSKSIQAFSALGEMPEVYVIFLAVENVSSAAVSTNWSFPDRAEPCPVLVFPRGLTMDDETFQQVMAHEVFHCFQDHHFADKMRHDTHRVSDWWVEGSAHYAINLVYPNPDHEHAAMLQYDPDELVIYQESGYPASLFFLHLTNSRGVPAMLNLIEHLPEARDGDQAQLNSLSSFSDMQRLFHEFGKLFLDRAIQDPSGRSLPISPDAGRHVNIDRSGKYPFSASTFTLGRAVLRLARGGIYEISVSNEGLSPGRESIRPLNTTGDWAPIPERIETSCDEPSSFQFLMTTTEPSSDQRRVVLTVTRTDNPDCPASCTQIILSEAEKSELRAASCGNPSLEIPACLPGNWKIDSDFWRRNLERMMPKGTNVTGASNDTVLSISDDGTVDACINSQVSTVRPGKIVIQTHTTIQGASVSRIGLTSPTALCTTVIREEIEAGAVAVIGGRKSDQRIDFGEVFPPGSDFKCGGDELMVTTPSIGGPTVTSRYTRMR